MPAEAAESFTATSKRAALIVAVFGAFMTPFDGSVVTLALPTIGKQLGGDVVSLGWIATAYVLGLTICVVPFGRLADLHGKRRIYVAGVALFTVASALCGLAPSLGALIATRFLQGVASAMMAGNSIALLTTVFPASERGKALGLNTAAVYTGLSLGPSIGGIIVEHLGWRSVFYVNVPIGIAVIALALLKVQNDEVERKGEKFDRIGMVAYSLALSMILLGLTLSRGAASHASGGLIAAGFALLLFFIYFETRVAAPLLDVRLFKNIPFAFSTLTALLNYSSVFGVSFVMSLYLQLMPGFGPEHAGFIMLAQPIMMAGLSPLGGWLSDRIEPRIVASAGLAIIATAIYSLSRLGAASEWWEIASRLMVLGVGVAFFSSPNINATMSSVAKGRYGVAAAILSTMRFTGQAVSLAVATSMLSAHLGGIVVSTHPAARVPAAAFMSGMKSALTVLSGISAAAIFISLIRGSSRSEAKLETKEARGA